VHNKRDNRFKGKEAMVDIKARIKNFSRGAICLPYIFALLVLFFSPQNSVSQETLLSSNGVVLIYHRFGEEGYPSTNTKLEQLDVHIA